ncbi:kinase-like domain-containing protein [Mycena galericulata]|nr:kinase-like domain-containing protein [Mycena galericulata]
MSSPSADEEGVPSFTDNAKAVAEGRSVSFEIFWRDHYSWLKESGYLLRPQYSPGWSPPSNVNRINMWDNEETVVPPSSRVMDATRISDGSHVMLKCAGRLGGVSEESIPSPEVYIIQKLSSEPLYLDPENHCVRCIEILHVPGEDMHMDLIVIPLLCPWNEFPPTTIGEAVDFFSQVFEGLQFMHNHNIWHGDCKFSNIMMDASPILRYDPHPWNFQRTREYTRVVRPVRSRALNPVKYYWIDFDLSGEHDPSSGPPLIRPRYGGTSGVPEWAFPERLCNPFAVDVWCLGYTIRAFFTEVRGFEFMLDLVADMTQEDPTKRPTMDAVVTRFSDIRAGLSQWKLRSRFTRYNNLSVLEVIRSTRHWARQLYFMARRIPAIPSQ